VAREVVAVAGDYEDVSVFRLSAEDEATLVAKQTECVFMWVTGDGDPMGVVMNFVRAPAEGGGSFWLTASGQRQRFADLARHPRGAVAISSRGTDIGTSRSVTYRGDVVVHDDEATKAWFYPALAARVRPDSTEQQAAFVAHLDSPRRRVIELVPTERLGFDSAAMFRGSPAGPSRTML